jgi:dTDP-4-dehydrorhamnose 3,5-epimerase
MNKTNNPYQLYPQQLNNEDLIHDVIIHPLKINSDPRGTLTECLKTEWSNVFDSKKLPFSQMYYSITKPNTARDQSEWHYHPGGQQDRFTVIQGDAIIALLDNRDQSPTKGKLNLFYMGDDLRSKNHYLLLVPPQVHHAFIVGPDKPAILFNFPTRLYDSKEEQRIPFDQVPLIDGSHFSWDKVKPLFNQ